MSNNSNNSNNNFLGPSLAQGQVFRKQQQTRVLTNNDVVTGNTAREQNKNIVSKQKNGKTNMAMIEPFSQKNILNSNNSNNYTPVSKKDIARDDERIKKTNEKEKAKTIDMISSYSQSSKNLNKFQQGVTDEAKAYNYINKNPNLLNQNYTTDDSKTIRVNNAGVINTLVPTSIPSVPPLMSGINISSSIANPPPDVNYIQVENIPTGLTSGPDTGLYSQQTSATPVSMPSGISGYNLEGENVFVVYPYPNSVAAINQNMSYIGAFTNNVGLSLDNVMPSDTTLNCLQRAVDKGSSWCGMTNYGSAQSGGGGGQCMTGTASNFSYAYNVKTIPQTASNTELKCPSGYTLLTFGADGVLYAGYNNNGYKFAHKLTTIFNNELNPTYGGAINNLVASYAYNQGNWQNLSSFPTNSDYTGQSSGTYNTLYQYDIQVPNIGYYTYSYYDSFGQLQSQQMSYVYYTTQTETQQAAPNTAEGNLTYINYYCGNNPAPNTPINVGGQNAGVGYNLTCAELYNQYPSFTLTLSDAGVLTISNTNSNTSPQSVTISIQFNYQQQVTLTNGQQVTLNMPRDDWVTNNNCINSGGGHLTSYSMNTPSMSSGQWISSPRGFCRLILTNDNVLQLEYSLQDVTPDADGNLVGNGSSVALYSIQNVNASNLGLSAHIDINGAVNLYPPGMIEYDSSYTEMKGYIPNPTILTQSNQVTNEQCSIQCNNDSTCTGYVVYNGNCNLLTAGQIFPTGGDRIPNSQFSTYIRNPKFSQNDKSCRDTLDEVIDSDAYSYYLNNGITPTPQITMTQTTKCNLGKVLHKQMKGLRDRNKQAVAKGEEVKGQFEKLFNRENNVLNSISDNRIVAQIYDEYTKKAVDKIQDIENAQITKSAAEKDSELLLISDNYRYVIWGIVSLLLSIAAIKGMRMASS